MQNQDHAEQFARAWSLHRQNKHDDAIREFNALLQQSTNNIDALYGLGLAQRSVGQSAASRATFERCLEQVETMEKANPGEDRYEMLAHMIAQRLAELTNSPS